MDKTALKQVMALSAALFLMVVMILLLDGLKDNTVLFAIGSSYVASIIAWAAVYITAQRSTDKRILEELSDIKNKLSNIEKSIAALKKVKR